MLKGRVVDAISYFAFFTGITKYIQNRWPRQGAGIIMFHRVRNDDDCFLGGISTRAFARQVEYLSKHYHAISLSELVDSVQSNTAVPPNSVVLTFDDGFRDNYDNAFPVLRSYGVPATIFLVTNSIDTGELPWPQRVGFLLQNTLRTEVTVAGNTYPLRSRQDRRRSYRLISKLRRTLSMDELDELVMELGRECGIDPPLDRMLTWEQVREMNQHGIEFGAHTVNHPLLAHIPVKDARAELVKSKQVIEKQLGQKVRHFCFPAGSLNSQLEELAKEVGFESFFQPSRLLPSGTSLVNTHQSDPHALHRFGGDRSPVPTLAAEMAGILEIIRRFRPGVAS